MNDMNASNINKIDISKIYEQNKKNILEGNKNSDGVGFKEFLSGFMNDVNDLQLQANDKIEKLASGEIKDIHEVMIAATEAETSFKIMMEMRNKLLKAYDDISKMK